MIDLQSWTFWDCVLALFRYKLRAFAVFILVLIAGIAWVLSLPSQYESDAMLFVRLGWENASLDPTGKQGDASANSSREAEMSTMMEHLRSRQLLEKAMEVVSPASDGENRENREKAFNDFRNRITIDSPKSSMIIRIAAKAKAPEEAQKIVATLTDLYLNEHLRVSRPAGSYEFLSQHSQRLREEFEAAQDELRDAKNKTGLASVEGRRIALENQISQVETKLREISASLSASQAKMANMNSSISALPDPLLKQMLGGSPNDGFAEMRSRLFELQVKREELGSIFTSYHPQFAAVDRQVEELETLLDQESPDRSEIIRSLTATEKAAQAGMTAEKTILENQLSSLQRRLETLNNNETNVALLTLKLSNIQNRYMAFDAKAEDARIEDDLLKEKLSNVRVLQPASFGLLPVGPKTSSLMLLVVVFGVVAGSAVALLSEFLHRVINQRNGHLGNRQSSDQPAISL